MGRTVRRRSARQMTEGRRAFSRAVAVTRRHTVDDITLRPTFDSAPVGLACWRSWIAGRGSCRGSIQRRHGHIMLELARDMRHERAVSVRGSMCKYSDRAAAFCPTAGLLECRSREPSVITVPAPSLSVTSERPPGAAGEAERLPFLLAAAERMVNGHTFARGCHQCIRRVGPAGARRACRRLDGLSDRGGVSIGDRSAGDGAIRADCIGVARSSQPAAAGRGSLGAGTVAISRCNPATCAWYSSWYRSHSPR